ncbi:hypothetical protein J6590_052051 [Homalodisca vitripennis]|nr:hypothetical protein J6590_052051 [Homalodisca vitripennis]
MGGPRCEFNMPTIQVLLEVSYHSNNLLLDRRPEPKPWMIWSLVLMRGVADSEIQSLNHCTITSGEDGPEIMDTPCALQGLADENCEVRSLITAREDGPEIMVCSEIHVALIGYT